MARADIKNLRHSRPATKQEAVKSPRAKKVYHRRVTKDLRERKARIEARLSKEQKQEFEQAADILHMTLTEFLIYTLTEATRKVIKEQKILALSKADTDSFVAAFLNPPEPNENLLKAAKRYKELSQNV